LGWSFFHPGKLGKPSSPPPPPPLNEKLVMEQ